MKILFFANTDWYLYNYRSSLIKHLISKGVNVVTISPSGPYVMKLEELGCRALCVGMQRRSFNPIREIKLILMLTDYFKRETPDLVHNLTLKCVIYGSLAAWLAKIQCIVNSITGLGHIFTNPRRKRLMAKYVIAKYIVGIMLYIIGKMGNIRIILQNSDDKDDLFSRHCISQSQIRIVPGSGVNIEKYYPSIIKSNRNKFRVLCATRLLWDKGIGEFIEAARIIKKSGMDIECLLAGSPDVGNPSSIDPYDLLSWVNEGCIHYLGAVEDIAELLSKVDLVALASYREGFPRGLLEASACGLPIIATDVAGCRTLVKNGVNGLLVSPRDAQALAQAIIYCAENPDLCRRMGEAGRQLVINCYSDDVIIGQTVGVYREILESSGQNRVSMEILDLSGQARQASQRFHVTN
jgi:glycosyltransferase involved in cell wall biosynthesis